jgi:hypothetical protein
VLHAENISLYYAAINKAELAIISENYLRAKSFYEIAFANKFPNGKDLYNAFLTSYYTKDTSKSIQYLKDLAFAGLRRDFFIDTQSNYNFYSQILARVNYDSCMTAGLRSVNKVLIQKLDSLLILDQTIRKGGDRSKKLLEGDLLNVAHLAKIVKEFGWPSFEEIGFWTNGSSPFVENPAFGYVMWHNRFNTDSFDKLAIEAVKSGKMRPDEWGEIVLGRKMFNMGLYDHYNYHMNIWSPAKLSEANKEVINKERAKVFLDNLEDYFEKFSYQSTYNVRFGNNQMKSMFIFLKGTLVPTPDQILNPNLYDE